MKNILKLNKMFLTVVFLLTIITVALAADTEQGFTVTSVSLTNILHPGDSASQTQWLVTLVLNGGGQSLVGSLTNSTINYQGLTSAYPLQISGSTNPEKAFYVISNSNPSPIYKFAAVEEVGSLSTPLGVVTGATSAPDCPQSQSGWTYISEKDFVTTGLWLGNNDVAIARTCIYETLVGNEAQISGTPNIQSSSILSLTSNGNQQSLNIDYSQQSATSSDGSIQANWVGSLVTGNAAPGGNLYVAINNPNTQSWNVQSESSYNAYSTMFAQTQSLLATQTYAQSSLPPVCLNLVQSITSQTPNIIADCMLNNIVNPAFATNNQEAQALISSSTTIGDLTAQFTSNYNGKNAFVISLDNSFVNNQEITLRLNGAFIGVVIPEGTPKIISSTSSPFNSGNNGTIQVTVENLGNAVGSFYASLSNCNGIATQSSAKYSVSAGQTQEIDIPIYTSDATQVINDQCTVTVTDYNGGGSDSAQVNVQSKPANQCTPNEMTVQGNYICPCVNNNGVYDIATGNQCTSGPYGVISNIGGYTCASPTAPNQIAAGNTTAGVTVSPEVSGLITAIAKPVVNDVVMPFLCSQAGPAAPVCAGIFSFIVSRVLP